MTYKLEDTHLERYVAHMSAPTVLYVRRAGEDEKDDETPQRMITQVRSPAVIQKESETMGSRWWCSIWSTLSRPQIYDVVGASSAHICTYTHTQRGKLRARPKKEKTSRLASRRVVSCRAGAFVPVPRCRYSLTRLASDLYILFLDD